MGLQAAIRGAVTAAFDGLDDLVQTATLKQFAGSSSYNLSTSTPTDAETSTFVEAVIVRYTEREVRDNPTLTPEDRKAILKTVGLTVVPEAENKLVDAAGNAYLIRAVRGEPTGSVYVCQVRPSL